MSKLVSRNNYIQAVSPIKLYSKNLLCELTALVLLTMMYMRFYDKRDFCNSMKA